MSESATANANRETLGFQAEVKQLLQLMIHSLYSNKEIFLRELVSNASDACDKLRFEALNNTALYGDDCDLKIRIAFNKEARTITISDNGIGLSRDEAVEHLGFDGELHLLVHILREVEPDLLPEDDLED